MQQLEIQQHMGAEFPVWHAQLQEAATRYHAYKVIKGVEVVSGKYLRLTWEPQDGGQFEDRGQMNLGSVNSGQADCIASNAMKYVGQKVRILDALVDKEKNQGRGYRQVVWVGPLPPELEIPEYDGADQTVTPYMPSQQPVQPQYQQPQQPVQPVQQQQPAFQPPPQQHAPQPQQQMYDPTQPPQ